MNYNKLLEIQNLLVKRDAMEKSYPRERELKLRKRKKDLLSDKQELLILEEKYKNQAKEIKKLQEEKDSFMQEKIKLEKELYSGNYGSKELTSIQNRLANIDSTVENITSRIDKENEDSAHRKHELLERKNRLLERMKDYEEKVEEYMQERDRLLEKLGFLDEQIRDSRDRLEKDEEGFMVDELEKFGEEFISLVKKGRFCSCCNILLDVDILKKLKNGDTNIRCENCGRTLMLVKDDINGNGNNDIDEHNADIDADDE